MPRSIYTRTSQCYKCTCTDLLYLHVHNYTNSMIWGRVYCPFPLFTVMYQCWNCTTLNSMPQKLLEKVDV